MRNSWGIFRKDRSLNRLELKSFIYAPTILLLLGYASCH